MSVSRATVLAPVLCLAWAAPPAGGQGVPAKGATASSPSEASFEITPELEDATRRGLDYLVRTQARAGYWTGDIGFKIYTDYRVTDADSAHVGVTGLAVMAFLACGELPGRGKHGDTVNRAVNYLLTCTEENGYIAANGTRMYSHAFATLALAEVYGMTTRSTVREALQRSVNLISDSQNQEGGWRYKPFAPDSDMSLTVCQVMALRAARNSGLFVPHNVIDKAVAYVRKSARQPGEENYSPRWRRWRDEEFHGGVFKYQLSRRSRSSFALTAAGVTTLYGAGVYDDPLIERGLDYMSEHFEAYSSNYDEHFLLYYGNYYAVQAFYQAGKERWERYFTAMREFLLNRQAAEGSWECRVGPGKTFATAVATLILAIPFQYLPIFQR